MISELIQPKLGSFAQDHFGLQLVSLIEASMGDKVTVKGILDVIAPLDQLMNFVQSLDEETKGQFSPHLDFFLDGQKGAHFEHLLCPVISALRSVMKEQEPYAEGLMFIPQ
ncbi:hypothetical protein TUM3794_20840 [Shewanella colwelliana]|uniref:Uncharacterized protein n=1 Tax=Shewanella colwelliana TaxID=23 RepID=A0ABQ4P0U7_SHECO|nr:hypothetical protein [Shewanella colwelliana]GIU41111.1 hypothetical protein TUM3794_20840 [Shewanella colwelliana]